MFFAAFNCSQSDCVGLAVKLMKFFAARIAAHRVLSDQMFHRWRSFLAEVRRIRFLWSPCLKKWSFPEKNWTTISCLAQNPIRQVFLLTNRHINRDLLAMRVISMMRIGVWNSVSLCFRYLILEAFNFCSKAAEQQGFLESRFSWVIVVW